MKLRWQIFWHVFFWVLMLSLLMFAAQGEAKVSLNQLLVELILLPCVNILLFYINYLVLLPQFLDKKRYSIFVVSIVASIILFGLGKYGIAVIFKNYLLIDEKGHVLGFGSFLLRSVLTSLFYLFLSTVLKFTVDWFLNERVQRDLENQRLSAELSFLKSQINPHFLFNSLNTIYSLAYQRSETTPEAILKLSEIMRYMLYECNDNKVELSKELQYLQNYIDLQKIRFANKAYIDFKVEGKLETQQIAPLLLIAFIENAFKHGIANDPLTPIRLLVDVDETHLHFYLQNRKHAHNRDASGGIGLNNVKRRLNLLYPKKYNLDVRDEANVYTVELSLIL